MKLVSWNVNGIRALERDQRDQWLWQNDFDVIALQETKASPDQLSELLHNPAGYYTYFNSATIRKGYSGVVFYVKHKPNQVIYGLPDEKFLGQGRLITLEYYNYVICNGYFPNGGSKTASLEYKLEFYDAFLEFINQYRDQGQQVIFGGDLNVAHTAIDLARPEANKNRIGFLPIERAWVDKLILEEYIDVFRYLNPTKTDVYTYWDLKSRARDRNVGWRIDYWFVDSSLVSQITDFITHTDILGSDHCPIELNLTL